LDATVKDVLSVVYQHNCYSRTKAVSAKLAAFALWFERGGGAGDIKQFDTFYRKIRNLFNKLENNSYLRKIDGNRGYELRADREISSNLNS